jgi:hypothetical protein
MKSLVGMGGSGNARELAEMLRQLGRGRDTVLAHITPEEAQMLMDAGGSGDINPNTGLPEFQEEGDFLYGDEFDPYAGQAVTSTSGGITPEAEAYYTQNAFQQAPGQSNFGPADQYFGQEFTPQGEMDIGFGPGRFAPEYTPRDVAGMAPDQFQRMQAGVEPSFLQSAAQGIEDTAAQYRNLARQYPTVAKMLSTGATTLPALINAIRARREAEKSAAEFRRLGEPLRAQGESLRQQALSGTLTPQQAAAQEASRARLRQQASTRGATTGTQQAMIEGQLGRTRAQLSETNLNNALKQLNLANAYDEAAIKAKLAADSEISNSVANIFANLGRDITSQAPAPQRQQTAMATQPEVTRRPDTRG